MDLTTTPDAGDASLGYGADNDTGCRRCLVRHGTTIKSVMEMGFWVPQWGMEPMTNISQAMPRPNMEPTATPDAGDAPLGHGANNDTGCRRCPVTTWNHDRTGHGNGVLGAPTGHCIPAQGATLGPKDPISRVLKERRIFRDRRFAWGLCGVPTERQTRKPLLPGLHPGLVCPAPVGHRTDNDTGCG